jgi:putative transposase
MEDLLPLTEEDREIAMQRFRWLQPHLEENRSLRLVAAEAGLTFRTAQRWVSTTRRIEPNAQRRGGHFV